MWWRAVEMVMVAALMMGAVPGWGVPVQAAAGDTVEIAVLLQGSATYATNADGSCVGSSPYASVTFGNQVLPLVDGELVNAAESPTGQPGCMVTVVAEYDPWTPDPVTVADVLMGRVTEWDLASLNNRLELIVTSNMHEYAGLPWRFSGDASWQRGPGTPVPTAAAVGESVEIVVFAEDYFGWVERDGSCSLYGGALQFGNQAFGLEHGILRTAADSPTGVAGCELTFTAALDGRDWYPMLLYGGALGWVTGEELAALNYRLEILLSGTDNALGREGGWRFSSKTTPVAGPGRTEPTSGTTLLAGSLMLGSKEGADYSIADGVCAGEGFYTEIHVGTRVTIRDEAGTVVGETTLEPMPDAAFGYCLFQFNALVPVLPSYTVSISKWVEVDYTWEELNTEGWAIPIELATEPIP